MLGESITKLRKRRGLTQKALADAIHVTQSAVSQWENNRTSPDCQQMFILSEFFGVAVDDLRDEKLESEHATPLANAPASLEYDEFAELYNRLSDSDKEMLVRQMKFLLSEDEKNRKPK